MVIIRKDEGKKKQQQKIQLILRLTLNCKMLKGHGKSTLNSPKKGKWKFIFIIQIQ